MRVLVEFLRTIWCSTWFVARCRGLWLRRLPRGKYSTWWTWPPKTRHEIVENHGTLHFSREVLQFLGPDELRWSQMIADDPRCANMSPDDLRWSQTQMIPDAPRWSQMVPDDPRDDPRWYQMIPGDMISDDPSPKWPKIQYTDTYTKTNTDTDMLRRTSNRQPVCKLQMHIGNCEGASLG